jgi:hypothetical protein
MAWRFFTGDPVVAALDAAIVALEIMPACLAGDAVNGRYSGRRTMT